MVYAQHLLGALVTPAAGSQHPAVRGIEGSSLP